MAPPSCLNSQPGVRPPLILVFSHAERPAEHWVARTNGPKTSPIKVVYERDGDPINWTARVPADTPALPDPALMLRSWLTISNASAFAPVDFGYEVRYSIHATVFYNTRSVADYTAFPPE